MHVGVHHLMRPAGIISSLLQVLVFLVKSSMCNSSFWFHLCFFLYICIVFLQSELTKQQNMFKIELKLLEDELLTRLSAAESNFLGDNVLVEKLETTKHTAAEIEMKVSGYMSASLQ